MLVAYLDALEPRYRAFFPIPFSNDFPHVTTVLREEVDAARESFHTGVREHYPAADHAHEDVDFIMDQAARRGLDLALINY